MPGEDYGKLTPADPARRTTPCPGPGQVQTTFTSDPTSSQSLNLLKQGNTKVHQRQPADPAGRRRPALRAAGLRAVDGRHELPAAAEGARRRSVTRSPSRTPSTPRSTCSSAATPVPRPATTSDPVDPTEEPGTDGDSGADRGARPTTPAPSDEVQALARSRRRSSSARRTSRRRSPRATGPRTASSDARRCAEIIAGAACERDRARHGRQTGSDHAGST